MQPPNPNSTPIAELGAHEKALAELQKVSDEYKETLQRLQADFENFGKRVEREKHEFRALAGMKVIEDFLPLMDSLGEGSATAQKAQNSQMKEGFEKIRTQMRAILQKHGVKEIETVGKKFDTSLHESIMSASDKSKQDAVVLEEFQKGYTINGFVLRPAKVKVNKIDA